MKYQHIFAVALYICLIAAVVLAQDQYTTQIFSGSGNTNSKTLSFFFRVYTDEPLTDKDSFTFLGALSSDVGELYDIEKIAIRGRQHTKTNTKVNTVTSVMELEVKRNSAVIPLELLPEFPEISGEILFVGEITFRDFPKLGLDEARITLNRHDPTIAPTIYEFTMNISEPIIADLATVKPFAVHQPDVPEKAFIYFTMDNAPSQVRGVMVSLIGHHHVSWRDNPNARHPCTINGYPTSVMFGESTSMHITLDTNSDNEQIIIPQGSRISVQCPTMPIFSPSASSPITDLQFDSDKLQIAIIPPAEENEEYFKYASTFHMKHSTDNMIVDISGETQIEPHLLRAEFIFNNPQKKIDTPDYSRQFKLHVNNAHVSSTVVMNLHVLKLDTNEVEIIDSQILEVKKIADGQYATEFAKFNFNRDLDTSSKDIDLELVFYIPIQQSAKDQMSATFPSVELSFNQPTAEDKEHIYPVISTIHSIQKPISLSVGIDLHLSNDKGTKIPVDLKFTSPGEVKTYISNPSFHLSLDGKLDSCKINGFAVKLIRHSGSRISYDSVEEAEKEIHFKCTDLFWASSQPIEKLPAILPFEVAGFGLKGRIGRTELIELRETDKPHGKTGIYLAIALFGILALALAAILFVKLRHKCQKQQQPDDMHQGLLNGDDEFVTTV